MALILRGKVQNGNLVFDQPLTMPEGMEVTVQIEPVVVTNPPTPLAQGGVDFLSQPFIGMWADREDMRDSVAWVRRERAKWQQRTQRRD